MMTERIGPVALPDRVGGVSLVLESGRIRGIEPDAGTPTSVALPPLVEVHAHLDRAYLHDPELSPAATLEEAIERTISLLGSENRASVAHRAGALLARLQANGVTRVRTHVDIDPRVGLEALHGVLDAAMHTPLQVDIVAFPGGGADPADPEVAHLLETALRAGARLLGGVPWLYPDPRHSSRTLAELALRHDVEIDVHVDETTAVSRCALDQVLLGLQGIAEGRVTFSHLCGLSSQPPVVRRELIERLVELDAKVHVQPATNLHLQRPEEGEPDRRGLAPVAELLAAGVPVRFGSDNVQDIFYPYGDGDPLETAFLAAIAAHVDPTTALAGICDGRRTLEVGDPADLVLVPGKTLVEILSRRPGGRRVVRAADGDCP